MQENHPVDEEPALEKPPFFKSWKGMYWLVLGNLAFMIVLFYAITKYYE
ncbi:hypothetical protein JAO76_01150 [Pontibacter sp. BT310]|uniref:Uncharacterized protein n=1 Tax=Pontibacter populi TaxID=890055 RepID=A0ABS6X6L5_9BACT|nr:MULTISPECIES: hypothetical protein [Pontibacter]MBJ6116777.1 hypothetical protein [Pontibacter sp. BT310]MBR0569199.1 hypothetical protein [Microvirga sp. STS03]MBW3363630.1 hypothetical protein [Pontibacter populi]